MKRTTAVLAAVLAALLCACGGGETSVPVPAESSAPSNKNVVGGRFIFPVPREMMDRWPGAEFWKELELPDLQPAVCRSGYVSSDGAWTGANGNTGGIFMAYCLSDKASFDGLCETLWNAGIRDTYIGGRVVEASEMAGLLESDAECESYTAVWRIDGYYMQIVLTFYGFKGELWADVMQLDAERLDYDFNFMIYPRMPSGWPADQIEKVLGCPLEDPGGSAVYGKIWVDSNADIRIDLLAEGIGAEEYDAYIDRIRAGEFAGISLTSEDPDNFRGAVAATDASGNDYELNFYWRENHLILFIACVRNPE